jgi:hypothetical protein
MKYAPCKVGGTGREDAASPIAVIHVSSLNVTDSSQYSPHVLEVLKKLKPPGTRLLCFEGRWQQTVALFMNLSVSSKANFVQFSFQRNRLALPHREFGFMECQNGQ